MTMFSMKPKFNLAEFLATPASAGAVRTRGAKRSARQVSSDEPSEEARTAEPSTDGGSTD